MKCRVSSLLPPASQLALSALLTGVVLGCANEEATHMKQVAGTYAMKSTDRFANSLLDGSTMTLDPDGTWRSATKVDPSLGTSWVRDSGTWAYRAEGPTLALRLSEGQPTRFTVKGDTLFGVRDEQAAALAEAVTGVKPEGGGVGAFYVRVR
jgi:hypothetical protein